VMTRIAVWPPIILIGLACATLSSAVGSLLVAPRTLQALAADGIAPWKHLNQVLASGIGDANEPRNATRVTAVLAILTVAGGSIDFVARIVSMFFMVTYGSLCAISFLEHFAGRPSYRPSFRSRWYLSLLGAVLSFLLMFQMDPGYALLSILGMAAVYLGLRGQGGGEDDLAGIFRAVMTQTTRHFQIMLQRTAHERGDREWRPNLIVVGERTFERSAPLQLLTWLCRRQGFGTYLHLTRGELDGATVEGNERLIPRLVGLTEARQSAVVIQPLVAPSPHAALSQALQMPSVTGRRFNSTLLEFMPQDGDALLGEVCEGVTLAWESRISPLVLRHGERFFGSRRDVHLWLTWNDEGNAHMMILLAYVLLGHPDWRNAEIRIFAAFPREQVGEQRIRIAGLIEAGRLPIARRNLRIVPTDDASGFEELVAARSEQADLVLLGFTPAKIEQRGMSYLRRHARLGDVLYVSAAEKIVID